MRSLRNFARTEKSQSMKHSRLSIINMLYVRYGLVEPTYSFQNLEKEHIIKYVATDPLIRLSKYCDQNTIQRREDIKCEGRNIDVSHFQEHADGVHLERWIKEIAQDRYRLKGCPSFPNLESSAPCIFAPRLSWDKQEVNGLEIDLIASQPSTNTIIIGSCKRSGSSVDPDNLRTHYRDLLEHCCPQLEALYKLLKLEDKERGSLNVLFYHFVTESSVQEVVDCDGTTHRVVSLADMLAPFATDVIKAEPCLTRP